MRSESYKDFTRGLLFTLLLGLAMAIALAGILSRGTGQSAGSKDQSSQGGNVAQVPLPPGTQEPTIIPEVTPSRPVPSNTPLPASLGAATIVTPTTSTLLVNANLNLGEKISVDRPEPVHSLAFAPTGDKLVYMTISGNLYWSDIDGSNATLIDTYDPAANYSILDDQMPKGNTLFVPGYAMQFTPGQAPQITAAPATLGLSQIRWWSAIRASGVTGGPLRDGYVGGEQLVTLEASGGVVSTLNVPYMETGAVKPGGQWLAYATSQQTTDTPFVGSTPQTIYLLNLLTGDRLQLTQPGMGWEVFSWSPDANWIYASAIVNGDLYGVMISADGLQWVVVTPPGHSGYDAVWSPNSSLLAFSVIDGGCDGDTSPCPPRESQVYVVNVPERKKTSIGTGPGPFMSSGAEMMRPKWSPDGSLLALLSFNPDCEPNCPCTGLAPAYFMMNAPTN